MEEYGKFFCMSEEGKENLENMTEAQLNMIADLLATNIRKVQWKLEDEMKSRNIESLHRK